ncbi:MAG: DNA gyrase/topoisomerase IV subunit A [Bacteroidales bacterium]|nr:DNA gyrase/topoisomerase IV subunit A [Bacteroidales bacterium]
MAEDWEDIEGQEEDLGEELGEDAVASGKFEKLLGSDGTRFKLSGMFREWYLDYASYTILDRAVPHIVDGFKPVQRRVLHTMAEMDDGRYTKVANIVGQAMQYHPHGDASILGALVTLGQKGLLIDCQGNWGNILTGDSNAAPRYIEARLSKFAKEVVFDKNVTPTMTSYDGRNQEPTELPVRFPLLLAQGTEGIAAGLSSKILPHNFNELIDASIAILKGEPFEILPDFPTGGIADCSKYNKGKRGGIVKVRARINKIDKSTITITEIPYGKTSHAIIDSIIKAKDKKKINIKKIEDMTTDKVEIVIHLPADVSPDKTIDALYAFTDCETKISPNACVIRENKPAFLTVDEILEYDTYHTRDILQAQLQYRMEQLENDWHYSSLERIFFENRIYKVLEQNQMSWEEQLGDILSQMLQYQDLLKRPITQEDILKLVEKPVRKISKFDTKALDEKIYALEDQMKEVQDNLDNITRYTIEWFRGLKKKYGKDWPRLTEISSLENITVTKVVSNNAKLYANLAEGFVGIGLKKDDGGEFISECSDLSEIIVIGRDGKFRVTKVTEKAFFGKDLLWAGVFNRADERTIYNVIYRDGKGPNHYAKRFNITSVTRDKVYDITTGEEGSRILWFTVNHNGEAETVRIGLRPKKGLKKSLLEWDFANLAIKGRASRGNLVTKYAIARITLKSKGVTTLQGKDIWYDPDIQRLNEDGRGEHLGKFAGEDRVLAIFSDGTYYTTSYDLVNKYQGDVIRIEKLDPGRVYTVLYWDNAAKAFYVKRFSFVESNNNPVSFISDSKGSKLVDISSDLHPQVLLTYGKKFEHKEPDVIDAEEFIAKKGLTAKGKKCSSLDLKSVEFTEPLHKPEDDVEPTDEEPSDETVEETAEDEPIEIDLSQDIPAAPSSTPKVPDTPSPDEPATDFTDWTLF